MKKYFLVCLFFSLSTFLFLGNANASSKDGVIYFQTRTLQHETLITTNDSKFPSRQSWARKGTQRTVTTANLEKINTSQIATFVKKIRNSMCKVVGNGLIKTWITVGGKATGIVVSASADAGMEVTIQCGK